MEVGLTRDTTRLRLAVVDWLTVERVAYAMIAVAALTVRLSNLGSRALGPDEAAQALVALFASSGQAYDLTGASPLLFLLQRVGFMLFGAGEMMARWWPALAGGLSPLLFYGLRDRLTRGGALMAALLWSLSPLAVFAGRLGLGDGLVPPLALALLGGVNLFARSRDRSRQFALVAAVVALLLLTGSSAYTVLLVAGLAAIIWRASLPNLAEEVQPFRRSALLAFLLVLILGATTFLTELRGLSATAGLLGVWFRGLMPGAGTYATWDILRRLLLAEPLLLGLGAAGAVYSIRHRERFGLFVTLGTTLALLLLLVSRGRHPGDLALVGLGLTLLAGPAIARLLRAAWPMRDDADPWLLLGLSVVLLTTSVLSLPSAANTTNNLDWRQLYAGVGIATTILTVAVWAAYGVWGSWRTVGTVVPLALLIFGAAWGIAQLTGLNYDRGAGQQSAVLVDVPARGLDDLRSDLAHLVALNGSGAREAPVDLVRGLREDDPLVPTLRWALRDFLALHAVGSLPAEPASLIITPAEEQPALSDRYGGTDYAVLQTWRPGDLVGYAPTLRWILYREATAPGQTRAVVLWVDRTLP